LRFFTESGMMTTIIETERLVLRELTDQDHAGLFELYQDPEVHRFIGGPPAPLEEFVAAMRERWTAHYREHGFGMWAVLRKADGVLVGRVGLIVQEIDGRREVEVGYALGRPFWGRGYALEAARACRDWAFRNLAVPHVISLILPENERSIRVAERNGMTCWKMADFKQYRVRVYRVTRREWERLASTGDGGG
jgi:ribosomal-protein-alanine N-acetyltransferase